MRQALAPDRDQIVASQAGGGILPANSFVPPVRSYRYAGKAAARFDPAARGRSPNLTDIHPYQGRSL